MNNKKKKILGIILVAPAIILAIGWVIVTEYLFWTKALPIALFLHGAAVIIVLGLIGLAMTEKAKEKTGFEPPRTPPKAPPRPRKGKEE